MDGQVASFLAGGEFPDSNRFRAAVVEVATRVTIQF